MAVLATPHIRRCLACCSLPVLIAASGAHAADAFAPVSAKATLSVEYFYESAGKKRSGGMYDPHEWRVKRSVKLVADLAAHNTTAMPTLAEIDVAQMGEFGDAGTFTIRRNFKVQ